MRLLVRPIIFCLGIALLSATLFLLAGKPRPAASQPLATPTVDRLAQPTLPASPVQADYGAQEFWSRCLPCHGDRGQGLTDEFRETYPPEDRNCWESGCHGERPYPDGWTIPARVPAVIGPNALRRFQNAQALHDYICAAMPYQWPGTLDDETCWKLTGYLVRQNGLATGVGELNRSNAYQIVLFDLERTSTPVPDKKTAEGFDPTGVVLLAAATAGLGMLFLFLRFRHPAA